MAEGEAESRNLLSVTIEEPDESTNLLEVTFEYLEAVKDSHQGKKGSRGCQREHYRTGGCLKGRDWKHERARPKNGIALSQGDFSPVTKSSACQ